MSKIVSIAAISENNVLADENGIMWDFPKDSRHYKSTVNGHITISGRKTYESGYSGATGEHQIVLTRNKDWESNYENVHKANNIDESIEIANKLADDKQKIYIIGGENIYREFLDICDEMIISYIPGVYDGSVYYPEFDESDWNVSKKRLYEDLKIIWYERK